VVRRRSKYGNVKTVVDGIKFDSKKEAARYEVLVAEESAGIIHNLRLQVPFKLEIDGHLICRYKADFVYIRDGQEIVEDVKGRLTDVYKLKKKLMKACHQISILET
jgi:hypothetical protein